MGLEQYRLPSGRVVRCPDAEPLVPSALAGDLYGVTGARRPEPPVPQLVRSAVAGPLTGNAATGQTGAGAGVAPRAAGPTPTAGCENTIQSDGPTGARPPSTNWHRVLVLEPLFGRRRRGGDGGHLRVGALPPIRHQRLQELLRTGHQASVSGGRAWTAPTPTPVPARVRRRSTSRWSSAWHPSVNVKVYVGPNNGTGPLDTYARMIDSDGAGDLHQLGRVRSAAAHGLHRGGGVDVPTGGGPGPDGGGRRR